MFSQFGCYFFLFRIFNFETRYNKENHSKIFMKVRDIVSVIEREAPPVFQEPYDNSGLLVGSSETNIDSVLICFDVTESVVDEAIEMNCRLVIAHHPIIFKGLKKITGADFIEKIIIKAIQNDIVIYAAHTNADNIMAGVNRKLADVIGIENTRILQPKKGLLRKLVTFCPVDAVDKVRAAVFDAGAGYIGNYDCCSFNVDGKGSFRANENTNPFVGEKGKLHFEEEVRVETIYPVHLEKQIIKKMLEAHPYEEVAYDIYLLDNLLNTVGAGMIGELEKAMTQNDFLQMLKSKIGIPFIKHSRILDKKISKVAFCGGSGSFLIHAARKAGADAFLTADIKYHDYFTAEDEILLADIGHYESEQWVKEWFYSILKQKFSTFAIFISEINTNPVYYL